MYAVHLPLCQILCFNHAFRTEKCLPLFSIHLIGIKNNNKLHGFNEFWTPPPWYWHCRRRHTPRCSPLPTLLISRNMSALKGSSKTSLYMYDRAHCRRVRKIHGVPSIIHAEWNTAGRPSVCIISRAFPEGTTQVIYFLMKGSDDPSVKKRYIYNLVQ